MNFLYNKRKDVPLLRGRIFMINLFSYPLFALLIYTRKLDLLTKLSYGVYFICSYYGVIASAMYHNNRCIVFDRTVYKRLDYAGIFLANFSGFYPTLMYYTNSDIFVILLIIHISINYFGVFSSLCLNFINTDKWFRIIIFITAHMINNSSIYHFYKNGKFMEIALYIISYFVYLYAAIIYAREKPNLIKGVFEFHELTHTFLVIGSFMVFSINLMVTGV